MDNLLAIYAPMKNEINNIEGWYKSAKQVADEIVITDTGSTDGSYQKIKQNDLCDIKLYKSKIFNENTKPEDWHFANARNETLSYCTAKWIIAMDADERIIVLDPDFKEKLKKVDNVDMIYCQVELVTNQGDITQQFLGERLFRNRPDIRYKGAMHNYVTASANKRQTQDWIKIQSCCKNSTKETCKARVSQRLTMAEKNFIPLIEKNPNDTRSMFYLARTYKSYNKLDNAIKWYEQYLNKSSWDAEKYQAALEMAQCFQIKKDYSSSSRIMGMHLHNNYRRAEGYIMLGENSYKSHDFEQAIWWFNIAIKCELFVDPFFLQKRAYTYGPWDSLSMTLYHLNKHQEAIDAAEKALEFDNIDDATSKRIRKNISFFSKRLIK